MNAEELILHKKLLVVGKNEKAIEVVANILNREQVNTILATLSFFDVNNKFLAQCNFDLSTAKYRIFDWLAMCIYGRWSGYGETEEELKTHKTLILKFSEIYLKCNGDSIKFVNELATRDLQVELNFN